MTLDEQSPLAIQAARNWCAALLEAARSTDARLAKTRSTARAQTPRRSVSVISNPERGEVERSVSDGCQRGRRCRGKYFLVSVLAGHHEILAWALAMNCDEEVSALDEAVSLARLREMVDHDGANLSWQGVPRP